MRSAQEIWLSRINECENGKESITAYCRHNHLNPASYYAWRKRLQENKSSKSFSEVELGQPARFLGIEVEVSEKLKLRLYEGYDLRDLKELIGSL